MIPSSFSEYAVAGHDNIQNGLDNALSAINYMIGKYGNISSVPGIVSLSHGGPYIGYSVGSRYINGDQIAQLHDGEMVTPKAENPYKNSGGKILPTTTGGGNLYLTITNFVNNGTDDIKKLAQELAMYYKQQQKAQGC